MSDKIMKLAKMGGIASLDLIVGAGCAFILNQIFAKDPTNFTLGELFVRVCSRAFLSVWMGEEVRSLMYPYDLDDPTNAALFLGGLMGGQTTLNRDAKLFVTTALDKLMALPVFGKIPTGATTSEESTSSPAEAPADAQLGSVTNNVIDTMEKWAGWGG
jgi:hypothetical protein